MHCSITICDNTNAEDCLASCDGRKRFKFNFKFDIYFQSLEFNPRLNCSHIVEIFLGDRRPRMIKLYRCRSNLILLVIRTSVTVLMDDTVRRKKRQFLVGCELRIVSLDKLKFFVFTNCSHFASLTRITNKYFLKMFFDHGNVFLP